MPLTVHANSNLSLYAIPTAYLLAFLPHTAKFIYLQTKGLAGSNLNPREAQASITSTDKKAVTLAKRLSWIHQNGNEIFPLFASAVIVGNFARLPAKTLNVFAGVFVASRVAFIAAYLLAETENAAWSRSAAFFVGMLSSVGVLFSSANKVFKLGQ